MNDAFDNIVRQERSPAHQAAEAIICAEATMAGLCDSSADRVALAANLAVAANAFAAGAKPGSPWLIAAARLRELIVELQSVTGAKLDTQ